MFEVAKTVVSKIKLAYGNFIRAHLSREMLRRRAPKMIGREILGRFKWAFKKL